MVGGRTVLVVAHRLSTVMSADRIAVVEGGAVREVGSHAELLASGGAYARLFARQLAGGPSSGALAAAGNSALGIGPQLKREETENGGNSSGVPHPSGSHAAGASPSPRPVQPDAVEAGAGESMANGCLLGASGPGRSASAAAGASPDPNATVRAAGGRQI